MQMDNIYTDDIWEDDIDDNKEPSNSQSQQQSNDDENKTDKKIPISEYLTASDGKKKVKASVVFIAAFKELQEQAKKYLKRAPVTEKIFKTCKDSGTFI